MKKLLLTTLVLTIAFMTNVGQSFAQCGCAKSSSVPCPEYAWAIPSNYQKTPFATGYESPYSKRYSMNSAPYQKASKAPCPAIYPMPCAKGCDCAPPCVTGCAAPCPTEDPCKCCCKKHSWFYNLFHKNKDCCKPKCDPCD